jgi:hypothetical protein
MLPCVVINRQRPRHAVLLTLLESALPCCLPSCKQNASVTPLESALTSPSQTIENTATLSPAESALTSIPPANPLESALTKNTRGGGALVTGQPSSQCTAPAPIRSGHPFLKLSDTVNSALSVPSALIPIPPFNFQLSTFRFPPPPVSALSVLSAASVLIPIPSFAFQLSTFNLPIP